MIQLYDNDTDAPIGAINDEQLQFLREELEEESPDDHDYYINRSTLDMFEEDGADAALIAVLRAALGDREEMEIRWLPR